MFHDITHTHLGCTTVPVHLVDMAIPPTYVAPSMWGASSSHPPTTTASYMPSPGPPAHGIVPQIKLPKLTVKKFSGELTKWVTFWDSFNSFIHSNPTLSSIDKFGYLVSLLESSAAEAVDGLTITSANYDEAVAILKRRFGNPQLIINRHMEALLRITVVVSHSDTRGLRKLYDTVESHIRGLQALGVPAESYGCLLTPILVDKLPPEIRLIVSRELTSEKWKLDCILKILEREIEAREHAVTTGASSSRVHRCQSRMPTGAALLTNANSNEGKPTCVYCEHEHTSDSWTVVSDITARKAIIRKTGRCYVCLRKNQCSKHCRSNSGCRNCRGKPQTSYFHLSSPGYKVTTQH